MAHFQMSTSGSKSNEHVDHFLVDIHTKADLFDYIETLKDELDAKDEELEMLRAYLEWTHLERDFTYIESHAYPI